MKPVEFVKQWTKKEVIFGIFRIRIRKHDEDRMKSLGILKSNSSYVISFIQ